MKHPEQDLQKGCIRYYRLQYPKGRIFHVPNGGKRGKAEAGIFKSLGVLAGTPDLILLHNGRAYFIEMKADKGKLSPAQTEWETWLVNNGFEHYICNSFDSFKEIVDLIMKNV